MLNALRRTLPVGAIAAASLIIAACASLDGASTHVFTRDASGALVEPALRNDAHVDLELPQSVTTSWLPEEGTPTTGGVVTSKPMADAYHARLAGRMREALAAVDREIASFDERTRPIVRWWVHMVRARMLIEQLEPERAARELPRVAALEREVYGDDLVVSVMHADVAVLERHFTDARARYADVLERLGSRGRGIAVFASAETTRLKGYWLEARSRAMIGFAVSYLLEERCDRALAWMQHVYGEFTPMMTLPQRFPFNLFARESPDLQLGYGWVLALYGTARSCASGDLAAGEPLFERALEFFASVGYADGPLIVASLWERVALGSPALPLPTRLIGSVDGAEPPRRWLPAEGSLAQRLPNAGSRLDRTPPQRESSRRAVDTLTRWHRAYLRAQVLIMMGRTADAEQDTARIAALERTVFGTDLNAVALRGEARTWLGDHTGAERDFRRVLDALDAWRPPTRLVVAPPNIPQLVALTRALIRARLGLALMLSMSARYADAIPHAERAEALLADVFELIFHPAARHWLGIDSDMFYGRGLNLGVIAASKLALGHDDAETDALFEQADAFFDALGFTTGRLLVEGMRVRALLAAGRASAAAESARDNAERAAAAGLPDLVWQLHALHGRALSVLDDETGAERAFRQAQQALVLVSGSLASDRAKRRFGIGKEDVTRSLAALSAKRGDWPQLFEDLERGRARAFVDLLARRDIAGDGAGASTAREVHAIDRRIQRARVLRASSPSSDTSGDETPLLEARTRAVRKLRSIDPELASTVAVDVTSYRSIRQRLGRDQAIAYVLPRDTRSASYRLMVTTARDSELVTTTLRPATLRRAIRSLSDPRSSGAAQRRRLARLERAFALERFAPRRRLYVVPSGDFHLMPWGALSLPDDLEIVVLPTGGWLARPSGHVTDSRAVVLGDPAFGTAYPSLPGARAEAIRIARRYRVDPLLGSDATEQALRERVGSGAGVLHLATHGAFDARNPLRSVLVLSNGRSATELSALDLFRRPLASQLVVLSACETGLAEGEAGDDYLGLARSFYLGGARAVLNSLWRIPDEATTDFMEAFHQHAARGKYARGWRRARDTLAKRGHPPSHFGAFVLGGSGDGTR